MALTDQELVDLVDEEFESALGAPGGDIALERAKAFDYYLSKPFGNEEKSESKIVTSDVADVIDGIMPSLLRLFTTADNLVSFDATGPEDEAAAEQESDYVTHVFFKRNPSFEILFYWMFDALVQKNGYVKAWWDETEEVTTENYEGLSQLEVDDLMGDEELEPIEREERQGDTVDETGAIVTGTVHDIKFRRVKKFGTVTVDNVPPEEFRISGDSRSLDPSKARMVGHEREVTRDELLAMGFDKKLVDDLPAENDSTTTVEDQSRRDKSDERRVDGKTRDRSQDKILLREAYIRVDQDGDGRAELKQVFSGNGKKLEVSDADRQPFHAICPHPLPHKHFGRASAEKVDDVQEVSSELLRQVLTNLYHTNRPGHAVYEKGIGVNTMDDLLTTKVGVVRRFKRPINESYAPMTVPFTAAESFPMIEYFDKVKRDRTGIASDSEGLSPEALKNIQTTVMAQATDLSKMKIETIARIFAETGFKSLFRHIHELLQKHQQKREIVKLRGAWVPVKPSEWRHRRDMTVNIGLGIGTREQNLLHLNAIWEKQKEMVEAGGMNLTVTPKNIFNTAQEIVKNAKFSLPSMYFTDPGDKKAPPPSSEQDELKKQQLAVQQRQQQLDADRNELNNRKIQLDAQEQQLKHRRELASLNEKAQEREDKFELENEKLRNQIAELSARVELQEQELDLKTATAEAQSELTGAQADQATALAEKTRAETKAIGSPTDDVEVET